jgi:DNA-binding MarR family transcriptional regulator
MPSIIRVSYSPKDSKPFGNVQQNLPAGLTVSQFSVLNWFIRVDNVATPGRLSTAFQVTKGAMTNTLKKLHEKN